jgi:hypothetical protein
MNGTVLVYEYYETLLQGPEVAHFGHMSQRGSFAMS